MHFHTYSVMDKGKAQELKEQLLGLTWSEGKARTKELTGTVKQNLEVDKSDMSNGFAKYVGELVMKAIDKDWIPHKLSGVKFNRYEGGGTYNRHTDSPMMGKVRTDLACTVFLTDPDEYVGGELCMVVDGEELSLKGKQGDCVVYNCGYPHWVNPVTEGSRVSGVTWIQSFIRDHKERDIVRHLSKLSIEAQERGERDLGTDIAQIHGDLMRKWVDG